MSVGLLTICRPNELIIKSLYLCIEMLCLILFVKHADLAMYPRRRRLCGIYYLANSVSPQRQICCRFITIPDLSINAYSQS